MNGSKTYISLGVALALCIVLPLLGVSIDTTATVALPFFAVGGLAIRHAQAKAIGQISQEIADKIREPKEENGK